MNSNNMIGWEKHDHSGFFSAETVVKFSAADPFRTGACLAAGSIREPAGESGRLYPPKAGRYLTGSNSTRRMDGSFDVIFIKGRRVGGVTSVQDKDLAIRTAIEMWEQLPSGAVREG